VTVRTKEAEVPDEFPPARFFLEDIEQIVRVLVDAVEAHKGQQESTGEEVGTKVTLWIKDQICDQVEELKEIASQTIDLSISVETNSWQPEAHLKCNRIRTWISLPGFTRNEKFSIYHKLAPIFKRRNLRLATLLHSHDWLVMVLAYPLLIGASAPLISMLNKQTPSILQLVLCAVSVLAIISCVMAIRRHSVIILRHSSERDDLRQDLIRKTLPVAIGCVATFLLTLLGMYLKHKYWP
jgi:hypothetical protein